MGTLEIEDGASPEERLAEAERRVETARRTEAEWLDLRDLELRELPASLAGLTRLRTLNHGAWGKSEEGKLVWRGDRPGIEDLAVLAQLKGLQSLDLGYCTCVADLRPLANLQGLQTLNLSSCPGVTYLQPLANLQGLQSLDLSFCRGVADLQPLAKLQGLQRLYLSYCPSVTDLRPLANLQALQSLELHGIRVIDVATFHDLVNQPSLTILYADEVAGIPREILSHEALENCLPRLRAYKSELTLRGEAENEVKVILLVGRFHNRVSMTSGHGNCV